MNRWRSWITTSCVSSILKPRSTTLKRMVWFRLRTLVCTFRWMAPLYTASSSRLSWVSESQKIPCYSFLSLPYAWQTVLKGSRDIVLQHRSVLLWIHDRPQIGPYLLGPPIAPVSRRPPGLHKDHGRPPFPVPKKVREENEELLIPPCHWLTTIQMVSWYGWTTAPAY